MFLFYLTLPALLPVFILVVKAKKIKETQRQKTAWEERLAKLNPVILRNVQADKEVVSGKKYYPSDIAPCDLFLLPGNIVMLTKKKSWRFPDISATTLAQQKDGLFPDAHDHVIVQSVFTTASASGDNILQIKGNDPDYALRTFVISFHNLSDDHDLAIQNALISGEQRLTIAP